MTEHHPTETFGHVEKMERMQAKLVMGTRRSEIDKCQPTIEVNEVVV